MLLHESPRSDTSRPAGLTVSQVNVCTDTCVFQQTWSSVQTCAGNGRTVIAREGSANYSSTFLHLGVGGWSWVLEMMSPPD